MAEYLFQDLCLLCIVLVFLLFGSETFGGCSMRTIGSEGLGVGIVGFWLRTGGWVWFRVGGGDHLGDGSSSASVRVLDW